MNNVDLTAITALLTAISAVLTLGVMQIVTPEAGLGNTGARTSLCQRASLALLATALAYDCYNTINTGTDPRISDLFVHFALLGVLSCWAYHKHLHRPNLQNGGSLTIFNYKDGVSKPTKIDHVVVD